MKLGLKFAGTFLPLLLFLLLQSGCTYALWTNGNLVAYKEPAQNPNLHVFESTKRQDFLVVYNEHSERTDSVHSRAYWLNKNDSRVREQKSPIFTRRNQARHLNPIPVFYSMPEGVSKGIFAVCDTNQETFTLYSGSREIGPYDFPVYHDHWGNVEKAALTPVAVSADVAVVGGVVAIYYAYCKAGSDVPFVPFWQN